MNKTTHKRLSKSLKQVNEWARSDLPTKDTTLFNYIKENEIIELACDEVSRIGMNQVGKSLILASTNPIRLAAATMAAATLKIIVADSMFIQKMAGTKRNHYKSMDGITYTMLCSLATGQLGSIPPCYQALLSGLEGGYGVRDGHRPPIGTTLRFAAFVLTILGDWLGKPFDLDKYALPRDPAWGQLVAHWREPDPEKLLPILLAACDLHVERIALTSREVDSGKFEFGSTFEAVYPAEILAIINLRRSLGLSTPFIDHPLMKTPYAALTLPPNTRLEPDELLEDFLKAACKLNPEAVPEGLYEAVMQSFDRD